MGPCCRPTVLGVSGQGPKAHGVDQHSCVSQACAPGRGFDQLSRITRAHARGLTGWTSCPWGLGLGSEGLLCGPALPGDTLSGPNAREVDQLSRVTRPQVRWPALSISCPGRRAPVSVGQGGSTSSPGQLGLVSECPGVCPAVPYHLRLAPRPWGVVQMPQATRASERGPAGSTICSW